ncbi:hypothetical protein TRFO_15220 [Tritrichomonas foetus]|uniref:RRM domain-containing protein n=1 Tax=Tritrichomonas foetus TaxID=1144522 RepID=A0A1J4KT10_9EUKA|nr:hypothetical protein TRFO_15220 [Tritrichomonas foetus]|eukprot:OHT14431.1 hypothetical protein TRFO_15220 [Tritrichomonas foetus]
MTTQQLWVGNTDCFENEEQLLNIVRTKTGITPMAVWFSRNRSTGQVEGYGFIDFNNVQEAVDVLRQLRDTPIPTAPHLRFKLNWGNIRRPGAGIESMQQSAGFSAYVGNLPISMDDEQIRSFFTQFFPNLLSVRLIHGADGISKGFGFIRFNTYQEMTDFINQFNNFSEFGRPLRCSEAAANRKAGPESIIDNESSILFLRNLDAEIVTEETLVQHFSQYGMVKRVKIIPGHADWANVELDNHVEAEAAKAALQGSRFGGTTKAEISFGRWVDESAPAPIIKTFAVPVIKPPKISRKLQAQFFDDAGVANVINTMELFSLHQRVTPLANVDSKVANRPSAIERLGINACLFDWGHTAGMTLVKDDPFI